MLTNTIINQTKQQRSCFDGLNCKWFSSW